MKSIIYNLSDSQIRLVKQVEELKAKHLEALGTPPNVVILPDVYDNPPVSIAGLDVIVTKKADEPRVMFLLHPRWL